MKVFSKEEASKYINNLIPTIKNIDDLVAIIQDSKYSNIKESKVFLEEDLIQLLRSLKLTLGALYTEDFAKLYLNLTEIPSTLRIYFVQNSDKKMYLGQDLYEYRMGHSLAEDISIDKVKQLIAEKMKEFDIDEQKVQKLIDKSLANISVDPKSIQYLVASNISKITDTKIIDAINNKLTEMDLQDTDKVEEARVKSIIEKRLNEVIITPTDVRDEVRKEFASKGITEELLNNVKNLNNDIKEALSKITISDEQIQRACQGLNLTENQRTEIKVLLNEYVKLESLSSQLEALKSGLESGIDTKIETKLGTELAKYVLTETFNSKIEELKAQISGASSEEIDNKINSKLENYVKTEFLTAELNKYVTKESLESKINELKSNILSEEALKAYVKSEFLTSELAKYAKIETIYSKEEIDNKVSELAKKSEIPSLDNYYNKTEVYNKSELDSKVQELSSKITENSEVKEFVKSEIKKLVKDAPESLDTIAEIAKALKNNPEVITEILNKIESKLDKSEASKFVLKSEIQNTDLTNYYKKTETYSKSEIDGKVAASGTFDSTLYYNKSDIDSKISPLAKKSEVYAKTETYNKSEIDAKIPNTSSFAKSAEVYKKTETLSKDELYNKTQIDTKLNDYSKKSETYNKTEVYPKTETYNKSEVDTKVSSAVTNETKVNTLIDAKLNPVKTDLSSNYAKKAELFKETAADAKYQKKADAFTKEKADTLYLSKTDKIVIKGETATEIKDTDEVAFRKDQDSEIKFIPVSTLKIGSGGGSSEASKEEISKQLTSRMGSFTLGDGYLIAKALKPYIPNIDVPERIVEKVVKNLEIKFDLTKGQQSEYGAALSSVVFYKGQDRYYPKHITPSTGVTKKAIVIMTKTAPANYDYTYFTSLTPVPNDYQLIDDELKLTISCSNAYNFENYRPEYILRQASDNGYFMDVRENSSTWVKIEVFSKDPDYFNMFTFADGYKKRYSGTIKLTITNNNEEIFNKTYTGLDETNKLKKVQTIFKDLLKTLPETEENKVIENLKSYNKQYIDQKINANQLVNKTDLRNELTNNIKAEIVKNVKESELMTNVDKFICNALWKEGIPFPITPSEKPKKLTIIIDNITPTDNTYGGAFNNMIFNIDDSSRYYLKKCSNDSSTKMNFILSKIKSEKSYSTIQSEGLLDSYVLEQGEIKGSIESNNSYDYLCGVLMEQRLLSRNIPGTYYKITLENFYPYSIDLTTSNDIYYHKRFRIIVLADKDVVYAKTFEHLKQNQKLDSVVLPEIASKDLTKLYTILNGDEAKSYIDATSERLVKTKFDSIHFLSDENLDSKIQQRLPQEVKKFADAGMFATYMRQMFDLMGEEWPEVITQKPTDFSFKINNIKRGDSSYYGIGTIKLTDNNNKQLFLKAVSNTRTNNQFVDIILTTNEAEAAKNSTIPRVDMNTYSLKAGEYKAKVLGLNHYNNGDYYWGYNVFNAKGDTYYNYFMTESNITKLEVTIFNFYPKSMKITNGNSDRRSKEFNVILYDNGKCYYNKKFKDLYTLEEKEVTLPQF